MLELGSVLDLSLNNWNKELSMGTNKTHGKKYGGSLSKDATKSIKCYTKQEKKGEKAPSTGSDALKKAVVTGL